MPTSPEHQEHEPAPTTPHQELSACFNEIFGSPESSAFTYPMLGITHNSSYNIWRLEEAGPPYFLIVRFGSADGPIATYLYGEGAASIRGMPEELMPLVLPPELVQAELNRLMRAVREGELEAFNLPPAETAAAEAGEQDEWPQNFSAPNYGPRRKSEELFELRAQVVDTTHKLLASQLGPLEVLTLGEQRQLQIAPNSDLDPVDAVATAYRSSTPDGFTVTCRIPLPESLVLTTHAQLSGTDIASSTIEVTYGGEELPVTPIVAESVLAKLDQVNFRASPKTEEKPYDGSTAPTVWSAAARQARLRHLGANQGASEA